MTSAYVRLSEVLPLSTPFTLMVDPTNRCNFKCSFCPTGDEELLKSVGRPLAMLSMELFEKILADLKEFPQPVRSLRLFKDGEPFLNKLTPEFISRAKQAKICEEIYIISNASLITKEIACKLLDAGLDRLRISVEHVGAEQYKRVTRTYGNYEKIVANVRFLYEERERRGAKLFINPKIVNTGLTPEELEKFNADFGPIGDELTVETLMGWSNSGSKDWTLGTNPMYGIDGKARLSPIDVCPEPFKGMAINSDGSVSVCCVDWSHATLIGNVRHERLIDIWNGEKMGRFRLQHLQGQRSCISACADCQYLQGHKELSHLDQVASKLVPVYEALHGVSASSTSAAPVVRSAKSLRILEQHSVE